MKVRLLGIATVLFFALPAIALAADETSTDEEFNPADEWELHEWVPIHIGPLDMSINKAVAYLMLGTVVSILMALVLTRIKTGSDPDPAAGAGRDHLRGRPGADRRAGAADQGDRALVPLLRDADRLHLGR